MPVPPYRPCAESDDDVVPVQEVLHYGASQSGGGENPVERSGSLKTVSANFFYSDITTVSIIYNDYRRPRRGAPAADRQINIQKKLPAHRASERP